MDNDFSLSEYPLKSKMSHPTFRLYKAIDIILREFAGPLVNSCLLTNVVSCKRRQQFHLSEGLVGRATPKSVDFPSPLTDCQTVFRYLAFFGNGWAWAFSLA